MLKCNQDFRQGERVYAAGDTIDEHPAVEAWLLDSFPAVFERVDNAADQTIEDAGDGSGTKDIGQPPADKMIRRAQTRK